MRPRSLLTAFATLALSAHGGGAKPSTPQLVVGSPTPKPPPRWQPSPVPVGGGDAGDEASCSTICPYDCTFQFDNGLNQAYCFQPIVVCSGTPGRASCTCAGHSGNAPAGQYGIQHTTAE